MKRLSSISLVLANLVVAAVVLSQQWGYYAVILIYWLEAITIGFFALGRVTVVCWFGDPLGKWVGMANGASRFVLSVVGGGFFIVKFGGFAIALGFFVTLIPGFLSDGSAGDFNQVRNALGAVGPGVGIAAALLFLSHGVSFVLNFIGKGEYKRRNVLGIVFEPYLRMVLVLVVLVAGFFATALFPGLYSGTGFALGIILLKIVVDLISHDFDHRPRASSAPVTEAPEHTRAA
jgi:hypothetical protein